MKSRLLNDNWKFWEVTNSFALNWAPPADAVIVDLPHDAMIEKPQDPDCPSGANTGYRKGGVYKDIVDASARSLNIEKLAQTITQSMNDELTGE